MQKSNEESPPQDSVQVSIFKKKRPSALQLSTWARVCTSSRMRHLRERKRAQLPRTISGPTSTDASHAQGSSAQVIAPPVKGLGHLDEPLIISQTPAENFVGPETVGPWHLVRIDDLGDVHRVDPDTEWECVSESEDDSADPSVDMSVSERIVRGLESAAYGEVEIPATLPEDVGPKRQTSGADLARLSEKFLNIMLRHKVSQAATDAFYKATLECLPVYGLHATNAEPVTIRHSIGDMLKKLGLSIQRDIYKPKYQGLTRKGLYKYSNVKFLSHKLLKGHVREVCHYDLKTLVETVVLPHQLHNSKDYPDLWRQVDVSVDGILEGRSSNFSLIIYSVCFTECGDPIPWQIMRTRKRLDKPTLRDVAGPIVEDLAKANLSLRLICCDGKQCCQLKGLHGIPTGYNPCNVCDVEGTRLVTDKRGRRARLNKTVLLPGIVGRLRTRSALESDAVWARRRQLCGTKGRKHFRGVMSRTPLLDIPGFDILRDCPIDAMHAQDLGLIKKMFEVIQSRHFGSYHRTVLSLLQGSLGKANSAIRAAVDAIIVNTRTTSEHSRCGDSLEIDAKASQFKHLGRDMAVAIVHHIYYDS